MSGYTGATSPFTETERVQIRSFCGFPAYAYYGWVFDEDYSTLEERMSNMSDTEISGIRTNYLGVLPGLKTAIDTTGADLDIGSAGPYKRNPNEMVERQSQYNNLRLRLCDEFGVRPGGMLGRIGRLTRA